MKTTNNLSVLAVAVSIVAMSVSLMTSLRGDSLIFGSPLVNRFSVVTSTPSGTDGNIQYNNGGALGASAGLNFVSSTSFLGIGTSTPNTMLTVAKTNVTSTLSLGSSASGNRASRRCEWNGANYTVTYFPNNSTTPSVTTSTSCQ